MIFQELNYSTLCTSIFPSKKLFFNYFLAFHSLICGNIFKAVLKDVDFSHRYVALHKSQVTLVIFLFFLNNF